MMIIACIVKSLALEEVVHQMSIYIFVGSLGSDCALHVQWTQWKKKLWNIQRILFSCITFKVLRKCTKDFEEKNRFNLHQ